MLKKLRTLKEIGELQAKARGNSLENVIARQVVIDPIANLISKVFKLEKVEKVTKEEKQTAKKILKEKYGIDVNKQDDDFFSKEGKERKARAAKPLQDVKKVIEAMAVAVTNITKTTEQIRDQNDQILNILNTRMMEKVDQIADVSPMSPVYTPPLPVGTEKSAGGIIVPRDVNKQIAKEEVVKEPKPKKEPKEKQTAVKEKIFKETDTIFEKTKTLLGIIYPELKDVFQKKNEEKTSETDVSNTTNNSNSTSNVSNTTNNSNSTSLSQPIFNTNNESLQPAMESIAEKKPLQSQIEPDELKILLKEALKEALDQLKTENPELFKSESGIGAGLLDMLPVPGGGGGRKRRGKRKVPGGAAKAAGKGLFKSAIKKLPLIGAVAALGFGASRAMGGDFSGAAMEMGSGLASIVPGIGTAASLGIDAALAAKDAGAFDGSTIPPKPATELSSMVPANTGAEIIEMNRRIQTGEVAIRSTPQNAQVVQRIVNNNVLPPPKSKEKINVGNNENTFNRLIEQDFDHPSTYSSFNMG